MRTQAFLPGLVLFFEPEDVEAYLADDLPSFLLEIRADRKYYLFSSTVYEQF